MKKNKQREPLSTYLELFAILMGLAVFFITDYPPLENTGYGNIIGILTFFMVLCFWGCLRLERHKGTYECDVCGEVHTPTDGKLLFSVSDGEKTYLRCPKCGKKKPHQKV